MKNYDSYVGIAYEHPMQSSFTVIRVLSFLVGRAWDQDALNVVHAVRPSYVRVVRQDEPTADDGRTWRVTVRIDAARIITDIEQEVEVGTIGRKNGSDIRAYIEGGR